MLERNQLKTVFEGYGDSVYCQCNDRESGAAWYTGSLSNCDGCGSWCNNNVPSGHTYTNWICTGPLVGGYGY